MDFNILEHAVKASCSCRDIITLGNAKGSYKTGVAIIILNEISDLKKKIILSGSIKSFS